MTRERKTHLVDTRALLEESDNEIPIMVSLCLIEYKSTLAEVWFTVNPAETSCKNCLNKLIDFTTHYNDSAGPFHNVAPETGLTYDPAGQVWLVWFKRSCVGVHSDERIAQRTLLRLLEREIGKI